MNVVSRKLLNDFGARHPGAKNPLDAWYKIASAAIWRNLAEVRRTYPHADLVGRLTVFNLGGHKYRLVAKITYPMGTASGTLYLRAILTHAEYDREEWKHDPWF